MHNLQNVDVFAETVVLIKDRSYKIAYSYLHNEQDSLDVVCCAIEKAYKNIKKLKDHALFETWFIRILINECKMLIRKRKKIFSLDEEFFKNQIGNKDDGNVSLEENMDLALLIQNLNILDRRLIYMKYYLGYTINEISGIIQIPEGTVKTRIYNNLRNIKQKLELKEV